MIAGMMGSNSPVVGFVFHMIISLMFGVIFNIFANMVRWNTKTSGVLYGDGSLRNDILFKFRQHNEYAGRIIYGLITGIVYKVIVK